MLKLLQSLSDVECKQLFDCLGVQHKKFTKGQTIFREGDPATRFGIVLSGSVNVIRYSVDGHEKLLTHLQPGEAFGTTFVLANAPRYFANIETSEPTETLLLRGDRVLKPCNKGCPAHTKLLTFLLETIARRNSMLARKIDCLTERKTSGKIMAYLRMQAELIGETTFTIPFTRQQLADYLTVDRAALSTEISKLAKVGTIKMTRKTFTIT